MIDFSHTQRGTDRLEGVHVGSVRFLPCYRSLWMLVFYAQDPCFLSKNICVSPRINAISTLGSGYAGLGYGP